MVFIQIIHSQSGSFHSTATGSPLKAGILLCGCEESDMALGRVGLFICSQKPIGNSSDHWVKKPHPAKYCCPTKTFLQLLDDLNAGGGNQPQRGGTDERHVLIALITNNMLPDIPTWKGAHLCQNNPPVRSLMDEEGKQGRRSPMGLSGVPGDVFNTTWPRYAPRPRPLHHKLFQTRLWSTLKTKHRKSVIGVLPIKTRPQWGFLISRPRSTTCNYQDCVPAPSLVGQ